jgi:hypothetical protein
LLIWLIGALVHTWEHRKQTWLVMAFVTASAAASTGARCGPSRKEVPFASLALKESMA